MVHTCVFEFLCTKPKLLHVLGLDLTHSVLLLSQETTHFVASWLDSGFITNFCAFCSVLSDLVTKADVLFISIHLCISARGRKTMREGRNECVNFQSKAKLSVNQSSLAFQWDIRPMADCDDRMLVWIFFFLVGVNFYLFCIMVIFWPLSHFSMILKMPFIFGSDFYWCHLGAKQVSFFKIHVCNRIHVYDTPYFCDAYVLPKAPFFFHCWLPQ